MLRRTILTSRVLACVSDNAAHLLFRCLGGDRWMPRATRVDSSMARDGGLFIALAPDREQTADVLWPLPRHRDANFTTRKFHDR